MRALSCNKNRKRWGLIGGKLIIFKEIIFRKINHNRIEIETVVPENEYIKFSYFAVSNIRAIVEREIINL